MLRGITRNFAAHCGKSVNNSTIDSQLKENQYSAVQNIKYSLIKHIL